MGGVWLTRRRKKKLTPKKNRGQMAPTAFAQLRFSQTPDSPCTLHFSALYHPLQTRHYPTSEVFVSCSVLSWPLINPLYARSFIMADSSESRAVARATKPVSEALLNEKVCANGPPRGAFLQFSTSKSRTFNCKPCLWLMGSNSHFDGRGRNRRDMD